MKFLLAMCKGILTVYVTLILIIVGLLATLNILFWTLH